MDPSTVCVTFFVIATSAILGGTLIPSLRQHVLNYGSRLPQPTKSTVSERKTSGFSEYLGSIQVPHTWFTHYYAVSFAWSIFWGYQIFTRGRAFEFLASHSTQKVSESMSVNQVFLAWGFMTIQGLRRLYESLTLIKPSNSRMGIGIWIVGIVYYLFMGISVWIEGVSALNATENPLSGLEFSKPSLKTAIAIPLFVAASKMQHDCHKHLASLKKYTLPSHPFFQKLVCPHYTSECLVYVAITIVAAPKDQLLNRTMLSGLVFVVTNLAITADSSKKWSVEKFGAENVVGRWRMVPYVY